MTNTFEINNYSILCSLNERTIYLKITDKIAFLSYEGNIDMKDFRLSLELCDTYKLVCKCFLQEEDHSVCFTLNSGTLKVTFNATVGGYLKINSEIILREKIMSNDSQLTLNFNKLEQQYINSIKLLTDRITHLEKMVENLSNADIVLTDRKTHFHHHGIPWNHKLNISELTLSQNGWEYSRIKEFYNLKYLLIDNVPEFDIMNKIESKTLEHFEKRHHNIHLTGIEKLPNLKKIEFRHCNLNDSFKYLYSYKHNIKEIIFHECAGINQTEITTYCTQNNIKLSLT